MNPVAPVTNTRMSKPLCLLKDWESYLGCGGQTGGPKIMSVHVGEQAGLLGSPTQRIARPLTGRWIVETDETADDPEMLAGLRRRNAGGWHVQPGRDQGCNLAERDSDVVDGVEFCARFSFFKGETKEAPRRTHAPPAIGLRRRQCRVKRLSCARLQ